MAPCVPINSETGLDTNNVASSGFRDSVELPKRIPTFMMAAGPRNVTYTTFGGRSGTVHYILGGTLTNERGSTRIE